jgi:hypothetical protein
MNVTTTGRPRKLERATFWSACEPSVKSGAAVPTEIVMGILLVVWMDEAAVPKNTRAHRLRQQNATIHPVHQPVLTPYPACPTRGDAEMAASASRFGEES